MVRKCHPTPSWQKISQFYQLVRFSTDTLHETTLFVGNDWRYIILDVLQQTNHLLIWNYNRLRKLITQSKCLMKANKLQFRVTKKKKSDELSQRWMWSHCYLTHVVKTEGISPMSKVLHYSSIYKRMLVSSNNRGHMVLDWLQQFNHLLSWNNNRLRQWRTLPKKNEIPLLLYCDTSTYIPC